MGEKFWFSVLSSNYDSVTSGEIAPPSEGEFPDKWQEFNEKASWSFNVRWGSKVSFTCYANSAAKSTTLKRLGIPPFSLRDTPISASSPSKLNAAYFRNETLFHFGTRNWFLDCCLNGANPLLRAGLKFFVILYGLRRSGIKDLKYRRWLWSSCTK